jgi:hypothetical protein
MRLSQYNDDIGFRILARRAPGAQKTSAVAKVKLFYVIKDQHVLRVAVAKAVFCPWACGFGP